VTGLNAAADRPSVNLKRGARPDRHAPGHRLIHQSTAGAVLDHEIAVDGPIVEESVVAGCIGAGGRHGRKPKAETRERRDGGMFAGEMFHALLRSRPAPMAAVREDVMRWTNA
jgi:hypothetical protein